MKYTETVKVNAEDLATAREFLKIENLEEMTDEELESIGAKVDDNIPLFAVTFENGNIIFLDVNSGSTNYYDDMWMNYAEGGDTVFDCSYEIPNEIEVYDKYDNVYTIIIEEE